MDVFPAFSIGTIEHFPLRAFTFLPPPALTSRMVQIPRSRLLILLGD